ncbi:MAG: hypothetical protein KYX64_11345 [Sphingopyxis sp.]|nr:hypothetical protein [Sphingopyxis sp.]
MNEEGLIEFLRQRAQERWDTDEKPYPLSLVSTELARQGVDYRTILSDERLKSFVKRIPESSGFKVVEHPLQRAKIGLIPSDQVFSFEDEQDDPSSAVASKTRAPTDREQVVISFLRALARLPDSTLDEVVIPTKVLVRLLTKK